MLTSEIKSTIAKLRGSRIPDFSVYSALRTMLRRKMVSARRQGREFRFWLAGSTPSAPSPKSNPAPSASPGAAVVAAPAAPTTPAAPAGPVVHKIAPGEAVILHVGTSHVETATNVHGKVVLERHRRPS